MVVTVTAAAAAAEVSTVFASAIQSIVTDVSVGGSIVEEGSIILSVAASVARATVSVVLVGMCVGCHGRGRGRVVSRSGVVSTYMFSVSEVLR